jgi:membrane-associated protease RseP (regulator of RpoE activity)
MSTAGVWALHTVAGGGLLLLLARLLAPRLRQPARRQRLGECAAAAALLLSALSLAPAWLLVPLPVRPQESTPAAAPAPVAVPAEETPAPAPQAAAPAPAAPPARATLDPFAEEPPAAKPPTAEPQRAAPLPQAVPENPPAPAAPPAAAPPQAPPAPASVAWPGRLLLALFALYALGGCLLLGRWLLGHVALARLLRQAEAAPEATVRLFGELAPGCRARLLLSRRVRVPFSAGLLRPVLVLPAALANAPAATLRWVLLHEAAHLARRDALGGLLFGLAQALFFPLPWFWWLRRQVRLCQEYLADAAAVAAGARPADYAEFLLGWTAAPPPPAAATGVSGPESDLFRRVVMLLQSPFPVERRCPRRWSLLVAGAFVSLAVLAAGVGVRASAAAEPQPEPKKDEPRKEEPRPALPRLAEPDFPDLPVFPPELEQRLLEQLKAQGADPAEIQRLQEELKRSRLELQRALEMARRQGGLQVGPGGVGGPRIGPDVLVDPLVQPNARVARPSRTLDARFGAILQTPDATLAEQLDLPRGQGVVLGTVLPDSAAAKAGLKVHDVLLEMNGKPVSSNLDEFARQAEQIKADTPVDVVVLRKGKKETVKGLKLPEAPAPLRVNPPRPVIEFPDPFAPQGNLNRLPRGVDVSRDGDKFKTTKKEDDLVITITGKVEMNKPKAEEIVIEDAGRTKTYDKVEAVPEPYDDMVKELLRITENPPPANPRGNTVPGRNGRIGVVNANGVSLTRTNDQFRITRRDNDQTITVSGRMDAGKAVPDEVVIQEGTKLTRYDKVGDVPEAYKETVNELLRMSETGRVRQLPR